MRVLVLVMFLAVSAMSISVHPADGLDTVLQESSSNTTAGLGGAAPWPLFIHHHAFIVDHKEGAFMSAVSSIKGTTAEKDAWVFGFKQGDATKGLTLAGKRLLTATPETDVKPTDQPAKDIAANFNGHLVIMCHGVKEFDQVSLKFKKCKKPDCVVLSSDGFSSRLAKMLTAYGLAAKLKKITLLICHAGRPRGADGKANLVYSLAKYLDASANAIEVVGPTGKFAIDKSNKITRGLVIGAVQKTTNVVSSCTNAKKCDWQSTSTTPIKDLLTNGWFGECTGEDNKAPVALADKVHCKKAGAWTKHTIPKAAKPVIADPTPQEVTPPPADTVIDTDNNFVDTNNDDTADDVDTVNV